MFNLLNQSTVPQAHAACTEARFCRMLIRKRDHCRDHRDLGANCRDFSKNIIHFPVPLSQLGHTMPPPILN